MSDLLITSAYSVPLNGQTPAEIMYMPAGKSTIRASVNGEPKKISVNVTAATANVLQSSLAHLLAEPVEPFIDFDHQSMAAAAVPRAFTWTQEGVMLSLDWTSAGKKAVEGKDYRYFSPTFLLSEAGDPTSLPDTGPVGALTNNPAFRRMKRITASEDASTGVDEPPKRKGKKMADETAETVTAALRTELETLRAENKTLKESVETSRVEAANAAADLVIEGAVRDGKIAPKNETVKASLKKWLLNDLGGAKAHIESLPTNPAFKTVVQVTAGHRDVGTPAPLPNGTNRGELCNAKVAEIRARFPEMTYADAWVKAEAEHPEIFRKVEA